jgi:hypothetical protein
MHSRHPLALRGSLTEPETQRRVDPSPVAIDSDGPETHSPKFKRRDPNCNTASLRERTDHYQSLPAPHAPEDAIAAWDWPPEATAPDFLTEIAGGRGRMATDGSITNKIAC